MRTFDVSDPSRPTQVDSLSTTGGWSLRGRPATWSAWCSPRPSRRCASWHRTPRGPRPRHSREPRRRPPDDDLRLAPRRRRRQRPGPAARRVLRRRVPEDDGGSAPSVRRLPALDSQEHRHQRRRDLVRRGLPVARPARGGGLAEPRVRVFACPPDEGHQGHPGHRGRADSREPDEPTRLYAFDLADTSATYVGTGPRRAGRVRWSMDERKACSAWPSGRPTGARRTRSSCPARGGTTGGGGPSRRARPGPADPLDAVAR